jgi:EAL domain-containing protein (putative c-di-GMP-specific phosphodiesterase class I)
VVPPGPFAEIKEQLDRFGVAPELLTIEITVLAVLEASPRLRQRLVLLRQRGIRIRLDGFGTGHSSLSLLSELRPRQ